MSDQREIDPARDTVARVVHLRAKVNPAAVAMILEHPNGDYTMAPMDLESAVDLATMILSNVRECRKAEREMAATAEGVH